MRLLLCLNRDLMSNLALNMLMPSLARHDIDIVLSHGIGKKNTPKAPAIGEWGALEHRIVEHGLFPLLEKREHRFQSFEQLARKTESGQLHSGPLDLAPLQAFPPDAIVSIRFGQIFKPPLVAMPRFGILNLHSGLLPEYRGVLATFWAMLNEEKDIGCTLHYVTDGTIDTGAIIARHALPADTRRSLLWNIASLYQGGVAMLAKALAQLGEGNPPRPMAQDSALGRYFTYPDAQAVERFLAQGHKLFSKADYAAIFALYGISAKDAASLLAGIS